MPRKGGGIAWASPFRSRKKKSEPEPVQSNWATGPPKHLREKTSPSFSGISHSQVYREKQHADDNALQWATVVRDSNLGDTNVSGELKCCKVSGCPISAVGRSSVACMCTISIPLFSLASFIKSCSSHQGEKKAIPKLRGNYRTYALA